MTQTHYNPIIDRFSRVEIPKSARVSPGATLDPFAEGDTRRRSGSYLPPVLEDDVIVESRAYVAQYATLRRGVIVREHARVDAGVDVPEGTEIPAGHCATFDTDMKTMIIRPIIGATTT